MHASSTIENHSISGVEEDLEQRKVKGYRRNIFENTFVFMEREREREKKNLIRSPRSQIINVQTLSN